MLSDCETRGKNFSKYLNNHEPNIKFYNPFDGEKPKDLFSFEEEN